MRSMLLVAAVLSTMIIGGCGAKAGYFFSSLTNPLEPSKVQLRDGVETLSYSFVIGDAPEAETVLFFLPGSGCSSLKYYLRKYLEGLEGNIRVFAMQKRHVNNGTTGIFGCPEGFDEWNHFPQWVDDHDWFVNKTLAGLPYKPKHILLLGVSEGGSVASALAARNPAVTHLAMIGHGGMKQADELRLLMSKQYPKLDMDGELAKVLAEPGNIEKHFLGQTYKYWAGQAFVDPLQFLLPLPVPIIVGFGTEDRSVPVESARLLERRFQEAGKSNLALELYPGADHFLVGKDGTDYRPVFLKALSKWLLNKGRPLDRVRLPKTTTGAELWEKRP